MAPRRRPSRASPAYDAARGQKCFAANARPEWDFTANLEREFAARSVRVRRLERPYHADEHNCELPELRRPDQLPLV